MWEGHLAPPFKCLVGQGWRSPCPVSLSGWDEALGLSRSKKSWVRCKEQTKELCQECGCSLPGDAGRGGEGKCQAGLCYMAWCPPSDVQCPLQRES